VLRQNVVRGLTTAASVWAAAVAKSDPAKIVALIDAFRGRPGIESLRSTLLNPARVGSKPQYSWAVALSETRLLGACRSMPIARSKPPVPPNTSLLFGHNATALLPHRASYRRNIRLRIGQRAYSDRLLGFLRTLVL
jgi:hypothetical protein